MIDNNFIGGIFIHLSKYKYEALFISRKPRSILPDFIAINQGKNFSIFSENFLTKHSYVIFLILHLKFGME